MPHDSEQKRVKLTPQRGEVIVVIIFLAAPGRCFVSNNNMLLRQEKAAKTAVLSLANALFGIFTGVINFYYICGCEIHEMAKNGKVSQCSKSKTLR